MGLTELFYKDGQTPLDEDEKEGLLFPSVTTREELDEVEQNNIEKAVYWSLQRRAKFTVDEILSEKFIMDLHKRMLGNVWEWAGSFRNTNKNIGVDKYQIGIDLRMLIDDCKYWIQNKTYPPEEIAVRFKHHLVCIHCFANGNGRHSRLMADIIIDKLFNLPVFTWGGANLIPAGDVRADYLKALRAADKEDYTHLMAFARS